MFAPRRRFRLGHWLLLSLVALALVMAFEVASVFFLERGARDLRLTVEKTQAWPAKTQVQCTIGPGLLSLARLATRFIPDVPPEARQGLEAVRRASVGVYHLAASPSAADRHALLEATAEALRADGWTRVVAVNERDATVAVFTPSGWDDADELRVCVLVCSDTDLVVVSADARVEPLLALAAAHSGGLDLAFKRAQRVRTAGVY